jgi:hypothetical protein
MACRTDLGNNLGSWKVETICPRRSISVFSTLVCRNPPTCLVKQLAYSWRKEIQYNGGKTSLAGSGVNALTVESQTISIKYTEWELTILPGITKEIEWKLI